MKAYALPVSIVILAIALITAAFVYQTDKAVGSVIWGGEYRSTEISSATGTSTLKTQPGSIGSIVIDKVGTAGALYLYATSASPAYSTSSSELIFALDGAADEGTYTYDVAFGLGLLLEERDYNGEAVITYR